MGHDARAKPGAEVQLDAAVGEEEIDLAATHAELVNIDEDIRTATQKHNAYLKELGLPLLPGAGK